MFQNKLSFYRSINISLLILLIGLTAGGAALTLPLKWYQKQQDKVEQKLLHTEVQVETLQYAEPEKEVSSYAQTQESDTSYYESVLRFHVRDNSDSEKDQNVKMKVKENVLDFVKPYLGDVTSKEECKKVISDKLYDIMQVARNTLAENGFDESVRVYFSKEEFPVKQYGDATFPAGEYEALRIDIGEAKGHNWWCMMYPALCFVDETYGVLPEDSKEELKNLLPEDEYEALFQEDTQVEIHVKFLDELKEKWDRISVALH